MDASTSPLWSMQFVARDAVQERGSWKGDGVERRCIYGSVFERLAASWWPSSVQHACKGRKSSARTRSCSSYHVEVIKRLLK